MTRALLVAIVLVGLLGLPTPSAARGILGCFTRFFQRQAPVSTPSTPLSPVASSGEGKSDLPESNLVIVGTGDVIDRFYLPALLDLAKSYQGKRRIRVTFIDQSEFRQSNLDLKAKGDEHIARLRAAGAGVIDVSDSRVTEAQLRALRPDALMIATPDFTHVAQVEKWLKLNPALKRIYVEKPVDSSIDAARKLAQKLGPGGPEILALDHYRAIVGPEQATQVTEHLGGGFRDVKFYLLEDRSGADPTFKSQVARDGAIENEQRTKALRDGVLLDLMTHMPPVLGRFAPLKGIAVDQVRAGQYVGVDGDPGKRTEIKGETFAEVKFSGRDNGGHPYQGTAYVGKGIRGVKALGPEYDGAVKVIEFTGLNGAKARLVLKHPKDPQPTALLYGPDGTLQSRIALNANPYRVILDGQLAGGATNPSLPLPLDDGLQTLELIDAMRAPVLRHAGSLPTFPGGVRGVRPAPYLEDVVATLPTLSSR